MKVLCSFVSVFLLLVSGNVSGQQSAKSPPAKAKQSGKQWNDYGDRLTMKKVTPLNKVTSGEKAFMNKEILTRGIISEVCQNKGCWMVVDDGGEHIRVEFKDYKFFIPWDSEGKEVMLQGTPTQKTISDKAAEHMASEMKHPPVKPGDVKKEQTLTVFIASGVRILGGSALSKEQQEIISGGKEREGHQHEE